MILTTITIGYWQIRDSSLPAYFKASGYHFSFKSNGELLHHSIEEHMAQSLFGK